jgi:hypothetical protein
MLADSDGHGTSRGNFCNNWEKENPGTAVWHILGFLIFELSLCLIPGYGLSVEGSMRKVSLPAVDDRTSMQNTVWPHA